MLALLSLSVLQDPFEEYFQPEETVALHTFTCWLKVDPLDWFIGGSITTTGLFVYGSSQHEVHKYSRRVWNKPGLLLKKSLASSNVSKRVSHGEIVPSRGHCGYRFFQGDEIRKLRTWSSLEHCSRSSRTWQFGAHESAKTAWRITTRDQLCNQLCITPGKIRTFAFLEKSGRLHSLKAVGLVFTYSTCEARCLRMFSN